jgi:hypothetical protein
VGGTAEQAWLHTYKYNNKETTATAAAAATTLTTITTTTAGRMGGTAFVARNCQAVIVVVAACLEVPNMQLQALVCSMCYALLLRDTSVVIVLLLLVSLLCL